MSPKRERTIAGEAAGDSGRPPEKFVEAPVQTDLRESCYQAISTVTCQLDRGALTLRGRRCARVSDRGRCDQGPTPKVQWEAGHKVVVSPVRWTGIQPRCRDR